MALPILPNALTVRSLIKSSQLFRKNNCGRDAGKHRNKESLFKENGRELQKLIPDLEKYNLQRIGVGVIRGREEKDLLDKFTQFSILTILNDKDILITVLYNTVIFGGKW